MRNQKANAAFASERGAKTGKGYELDGDYIRASHADVDGKIYIGGANGVIVLTSTKGLPK